MSAPGIPRLTGYEDRRSSDGAVCGGYYLGLNPKGWGALLRMACRCAACRVMQGTNMRDAQPTQDEPTQDEPTQDEPNFQLAWEIEIKINEHGK
jgi:hypothetical protein